MIIAVASGKGGTGKTLVATSLALSLSEEHHVQLLDCDVEEPNDHIFIKPTITDRETVSIPVPVVDEAKCSHCGKCAAVCAYHAIAVIKDKVLTFPELCHGCGACSYLCPEKAITEENRAIGAVETGYSNGIGFTHGRLAIGQPMATPIIRKVKEKADQHEIVIIDASPGTSCPVIEAVRDTDYVILVTEPTPFGLSDLKLAVEMTRELDIPFGVVINRDMDTTSVLEDYFERENIDILARIPLRRDIAETVSRGNMLLDYNNEIRNIFQSLFELIASKR